LKILLPPAAQDAGGVFIEQKVVQYCGKESCQNLVGAMADNAR